MPGGEVEVALSFDDFCELGGDFPSRTFRVRLALSHSPETLKLSVGVFEWLVVFGSVLVWLRTALQAYGNVAVVRDFRELHKLGFRGLIRTRLSKGAFREAQSRRNSSTLSLWLLKDANDNGVLQAFNQHLSGRARCGCLEVGQIPSFVFLDGDVVQWKDQADCQSDQERGVSYVSDAARLHHCGCKNSGRPRPRSRWSMLEEEDRPSCSEKVRIDSNVIGAQQVEQDRNQAECTTEGHDSVCLSPCGLFALSQQAGLAYDGVADRQKTHQAHRLRTGIAGENALSQEQE